jgi:DMSO reductase family type II enzyme heme b subunit
MGLVMKLQKMKLLQLPMLMMGLALGVSGCSEPSNIQESSVDKMPKGQLVSANDTVKYSIFTDDKSTQLLKSTDALWQNVKMYQIDLALAPPVHQSITLRQSTAAQPAPLNFQVTQDSQNFYIRLSWQDDSENKVHAFEKFADSAAIQFAIKGKDTTSFMMGSPDAPVNIWYWNAAKAQTQNLAAGGFGTLSPTEQQVVSTQASYQNNHWSVVFSREKAITGDYQVDLSKQDIDVVFATWQGNTKQRDGLKATSGNWITLSTAP